MKNKGKTTFKWGEAHPVVFGLMMTAVVMMLARLAEAFIEAIAGGVAAMAVYGTVSSGEVGNMGLVSTAISLLSHMATLLLFWFIFRKELHNFFNIRKFNRIFLLGWSSLAIDAFTLVVGLLNHKSYGNFGTALLLGMEPGISEEVLYRTIPICFAMKSKKREQMVVPVMIFTSVLFGLRHGLNVFYGADPVTTLFQVLYSTGTGFLFAAIYIGTGDLWITMFLHSVTDTIYFLGAEAQSGGGVLSGGTNASDAVIMLIYAALYFVNAFFVFRSTRAEISDVWSGTGQVKAEA